MRIAGDWTLPFTQWNGIQFQIICSGNLRYGQLWVLAISSQNIITSVSFSNGFVEISFKSQFIWHCRVFSSVCIPFVEITSCSLLAWSWYGSSYLTQKPVSCKQQLWCIWAPCSCSQWYRHLRCYSLCHYSRQSDVWTGVDSGSHWCLYESRLRVWGVLPTSSTIILDICTAGNIWHDHGGRFPELETLGTSTIHQECVKQSHAFELSTKHVKLML